MKRRDALKLAQEMDRAGIEFDRVYSWRQDGSPEADSWFISTPIASGNTIRTKAQGEALLANPALPGEH